MTGEQYHRMECLVGLHHDHRMTGMEALELVDLLLLNQHERPKPAEQGNNTEFYRIAEHEEPFIFFASPNVVGGSLMDRFTTKADLFAALRKITEIRVIKTFRGGPVALKGFVRAPNSSSPPQVGRLTLTFSISDETITWDLSI